MTLREWLAAEPWTLTLSSGFFGFFAHTGLLSVLEEEGLRPRLITGSSAGALAGGLWASGMSTAEMTQRLAELQRGDFWDPFPGAGMLRGRKFRQLLERMLPVENFEAMELPFKVSVFDSLSRKTVVLDKGPLAPAIHASCAVPLMFHPVWINKRPYVDGGVLDRPGIAGVPKNERVLYHHLISHSRWRRPEGQHSKLPERDKLVSLVFKQLPRVSPFKLEQGLPALELARSGMRHALEQSVKSRITV